MSADVHDPREAFFVFCLVSPAQAIKEWIPAEEPDLDWFDRPRNPSVHFSISALPKSPFSPAPPFFPASGPATGSFSGLQPKSNFLAIMCW